MNRIQIRRADIHDLGLITPLFDLYRSFMNKLPTWQRPKTFWRNAFNKMNR